MPLNLKVLSYKNRPPAKALSADFDQQGGTVGRYSANQLAPVKNHFTLECPDLIVSGKHAEIHYENGRFYLTDTSTNGTVISNKNIELIHETAPLDDGDRIQIGDYDLIVEIDIKHGQPRNGPILGEQNLPGNPEIPHKDSDIAPIDISDFFKPKTIAEKHPHSETSAQAPPPDRTEKTLTDCQEPCNRLLDVFYEAAKIADTSPFVEEDDSELMRTVGCALRELVDGLMDMLSGRRVIKRELRVKGTRLESKENNPLKFAQSVEDALKLMLTKRHSGFMSAADAVHEGYVDVKNHQLAFAAGVQASLKHMIEKFDPEKFAQERQNGFVLKNIKLWEAYCHEYGRIAKEAEDSFFGDEFSFAYDRQISELRAIQHSRLVGSEEK